MEQITDTDIINNISNLFDINQASTAVPNIAESIILPVIDVNPLSAPKANIIASVGEGSSGTYVIYTTPTNVNFYLTQVIVGESAISNNQPNTFEVDVYVGGVKNPILAGGIVNNTINNVTPVILTVNPPLLIDAGTNINFVLTGTINSGVVTAIILGFTFNSNPYQGYLTSTGTT